MIHHFLLTRFNIPIWRHDKCGDAIDRGAWLGERLELFETYCLPSVMGQSCQDFEWILLVDAETDDAFRSRIKGYKEQCPQIHIVLVKPEAGCKFASVFKSVVNKHLKEMEAKEDDLCLTTYLDNDDSLGLSYVETVQRIAAECRLGSFIVFDYGLQLFTENGVATKIRYSNNHFMTAVEEAGDVRTCYGYGSHFLLEKRKIARVNHIVNRDKCMWVEVIHDCNVDNDVKMTTDTTLISDENILRRCFNVDRTVSGGHRMWFLLRYLSQMKRRIRDKFIPRKW